MKNLIIGLMLMFPLITFSQEKKGIVNILEREYVPVSISYYGNLITHPGLKVGFDYSLFGIEKTKVKKRKTKVIRKLLYFTPSVAIYSHPQSHVGVLVSTDLGWRRYNTRFGFSEVQVGVGYMTRINGGETWEVTGGSVKKRKTAGARGYFAPSISYGFGKAFATKYGQSAIFGRANANILLGYNAGWLPELSVEVGFRLNPNFGIRNHKIQVKQKTKGGKK